MPGPVIKCNSQNSISDYDFIVSTAEIVHIEKSIDICSRRGAENAKENE